MVDQQNVVQPLSAGSLFVSRLFSGPGGGSGKISFVPSLWAACGRKRSTARERRERGERESENRRLALKKHGELSYTISFSELYIANIHLTFSYAKNTDSTA